jgi:HSP20 family protein
MKKVISASFLSFIFGGLLTYFVTDYIRLKSNHNSDQQLSYQSTAPIKLKNNDINNSFKNIDQFHQQMQRQMDKMFDRKSFLDSSFFDSGLFGNIGGALEDDLSVEHHEDEKFKYIEINGRGLDKDAINVDISNGMVSISGEIKNKSDNQDRNSFIRSQSISTFSKSFSIPRGVNENKVEIDTEGQKIIIKFPKLSV